MARKENEKWRERLEVLLVLEKKGLNRPTNSLKKGSFCNEASFLLFGKRDKSSVKRVYNHIHLYRKKDISEGEQQTHEEETEAKAVHCKGSLKSVEVEVQLSPTAEELVDKSFIAEPPMDVLVKYRSGNIKRCDLSTLKGLNWLNDEVVNAYMELINMRSIQPSQHPTCHVYNTFFHVKLKERGMDKIEHWTKGLDIWKLKILLVPVNENGHWSLMIVEVDDKKISYLDSLGLRGEESMKLLLDYLEYLAQKQKKAFDASEWTQCTCKDIPRQNNFSDCGVFLCVYAERTARRAPLTFGQDDMPYFRRRIAYELLTKSLLAC